MSPAVMKLPKPKPKKAGSAFRYNWPPPIALQAHDNIDVVGFIEAVARTRGLQCGVKYAEGFQVAKIWPRLKTERILP